MRVCLINPPLLLKKSVGMPYVFQPLGLLYIAAVLEKEHEVSVIDAVAEGWQDIATRDGKYCLGLDFEAVKCRVASIKPDVVGISVQFSINEYSALQIASAVKFIDSKIITVLGGPHVTVRPVETLASPSVDIVVVGEGELTMQELLRKLSADASADLGGILGVGFKRNGVAIVSPPRPLIENLDILPFPARHLVPMEKYFEARRARRGARELYTFSDRWTSVITSRGCTYSCVFCSIHSTMGRRFRKRSPENVIAEIRQAVDRYGIRHINFEDDNLTLDKNRAIRIFELMQECRCDVSWSTPNGVRVENIDDEMVNKMKASGCKRVFVAPESGVQRVVRDIIGKNLDLTKIDNAVVLFNKYGIIVDGSFVIGFIDETKAEMWETVRYIRRLKKLGLEEIGLHIATPYYGTKLYFDALQKGYLKKDFNNNLLYTGEALIDTPEWSANDVKRIAWMARLSLAPGVKNKILYLLTSIPQVRMPLRKLKDVMIRFWHRCAKITAGFDAMSQMLKSMILFIYEKMRNRLPKPELIVFEVTNACNSRCTHCYIWKQPPTKDLVTADDIRKTLHDKVFDDLKVVLLTGGEAVLRADIDDIIRAIHETRPLAQISLSTNALSPDRVIATVTRAVRNGIRINVGISLDAVGERHDQLRGVEGNFERAHHLINELRKLKSRYGDDMGSLVIGHTLSNLTIDTIADVNDFARKFNIGFVTQLHEKFSYYHNKTDDCSNAHDYRKVDNGKLIAAVRQLPISFHNIMLLSALRHKLKYRCASFRKFFLLRCDGSIAPCLHFNEMIVGNIRSESMSQIWKNKKADIARDKIALCNGCSNSWATDWSRKYWPISFWKEILEWMFYKLFYDKT